MDRIDSLRRGCSFELVSLDSFQERSVVPDLAGLMSFLIELREHCIFYLFVDRLIAGGVIPAAANYWAIEIVTKNLVKSGPLVDRRLLIRIGW